MINTEALEHCFDHTTQSYKFYWMMSILECVANQRYSINIMELSARMASMAWYPILKHSVGFGKTDSFRPQLSKLQQQALRAFLTGGGSEGLAAIEFSSWNIPVTELVRMPIDSFTRAYEACLSGASFQHTKRSLCNSLSSACAADDLTRHFNICQGATYIEHQHNR